MIGLKGRRVWSFVVLAVLAIAGVVSLAACGGSGGDGGGQYDFNGTWAAEVMVVQSNIPQVPVGYHGTDVARVTQSGTNISVSFEGVVPLTGTCDPAAGTFTASGVDGPLTVAMNGAKVDEDSMAGEITMSGGAVFVRMAYTANLVSRNRMAAGVVRGGSVAVVLDSLR